jgi:PAS domain S-box-containing protein
MAEMMGCTGDEMVGRLLYEFVDEDERAKAKRLFECRKDGVAERHDFEFVRGDGSRFKASLEAGPIVDKEGNFVGAIACVTDITGRTMAEEAIRDSEKKYRELVEDINDVVFAVSADGTISYINKRVKAFTGWTSDEIVGRHIMEFIHPDDHGNMAERFAKHIAGEGQPDEFRVPTKKGHILWVRSSARTVVEDGKVVGLRGILTDITAEKMAEEENLRIAKLESLAVLAGGIAHDFNNILTAVTANLSVASREAAAGEDVLDSIDDARRAAALAKALTNQLLSLSKGGEPVKKALEFSELLEERVHLALSGSSSKADLSVADDLWAVEMDPGQIGQAIENLVINADQAMPDGGTIRIVAQNLVHKDTGGGARSSYLPGSYVKVTVQDDGVGISEEHQQRIFDPYFTTKDGGSGLGLATAHSVVGKHGGRISVSSDEGQGTTFTVLLPAYLGEARESIIPPKIPLEGHERILVMDDDPMVLRSASRVLLRLGYDIDTAIDGASALGAYRDARDKGRPFDLVIMDIVIPGAMGAKEAIKELLELDPGARAIVSSGYSTDPIMADHRAYGFRAAVAKPWNLEELGRAIREVLDTD